MLKSLATESLNPVNASSLSPAIPLTLDDRFTGEHKRQFVLAAIDIGTNSVHMVVASIDATLPAFSIIGQEKDTVRLGEFCEETGNLTEAAMERCIASLKRCVTVADKFKADDLVAVATSAVREAGNGQVFIDRVREEVGLSIQLISGSEEARRIYLGVISGMELKGKPHVVIDIGGGSTEIILGNGGPPDFLSSSKVGAVRLTAKMVSTDPLSKKEYEYLQAYVRGVLEPTIDELKRKRRKLLASDDAPPEPLRLIGTSGTIECLAIISALERTGVVPEPLNGYCLSYETLCQWVSRLRKMSYAERLALPGMSDRRAEIIVSGAVILQTAMALLGVDHIKICERSLREGVVVDWMLTHHLIEDRMAFQDSVRDRSVRRLARKYNAQGDRVAKFAITLFDQTHGLLHSLGALEREYLWVAAMLHNSGHYVSHSSHHKHSYYLIRHGGLLGFTEAEVEIIANIARYHRKTLPKRRHENYQNLPTKQARQLVDQLGSILRLAVALDRGHSGTIAAISTEYSANPTTGQRTLTLTISPTQADNNCELELWNINDRKAWFETVFGLQLVAKLAHKDGVTPGT
jgi:exopolyphosphatase / guanosine-5'-triphosphate,3'-diphosphate pyrophosphatase